MPATPSTPLQPHIGEILSNQHQHFYIIVVVGYSSLPRSSHSDVGGSHIEMSNSAGLLSGLDCGPNQNYSDIASLETVTEDQEGVTGAKLRTIGKISGC